MRVWGRSVRKAGLAAAMAGALAGCQAAGSASLDPSAVADPVAVAEANATEPPKMMAPPSPELGKAKQFFRDRNFGFAEQTFRSVVETDPKNAEAWLGLGATYDELRRFDLADRAYAQALKLIGPTAQLLNNRGYSQLLRGNYGAARRDLAAAQAKDPANPHIARNLALLSQR